MLRTRPVRNRLICGINATVFNMVMVVAALAVFFIESAATPPFDSQNRSFHLPNASHPAPLYRADRSDAIKISVVRDSKVFYRCDLLDPGDIKSRILQDLARGSERKVYLQIDVRVRYAVVKNILNSIQAAGIENISFFAREPLTF